MADRPSELEYWTNLRDKLKPSSVAHLDFDELDRWIEELIGRLPQLSQSSSELAMLRTDYEKRAAGMLKAIAAVERSRTGLESANLQIEQLSSLSVGDLLKQQRSISARFRDLFPGSLGIQRQLNRRNEHAARIQRS